MQHLLLVAKELFILFYVKFKFPQVKEKYLVEIRQCLVYRMSTSSILLDNRIEWTFTEKIRPFFLWHVEIRRKFQYGELFKLAAFYTVLATIQRFDLLRRDVFCTSVMLFQWHSCGHN